MKSLLLISLAQHFTLPAPYLGQGFEAHLFYYYNVTGYFTVYHYRHIVTWVTVFSLLDFINILFTT
jgi:hypothetical protein